MISPRTAAAFMLALAAPLTVQADEDAELAQRLANPVANLISVPFQFNYDTSFGPADADRYTLNVQPVVPFPIDEEWNLITRTIVPVIYQEGLADGLDSDFGLGDTVQSFFLSPQAPTSDGWIWGAGPVFLWPTATDTSLGSGQWGLGPTGVALRQDGPWTYGLLANHIWSYAGDDDRGNVNASFGQPFLVYTTPMATSYFVNMEAIYDWNESQWLAPVNAGVNQLLKLGGQPMQIGLAGRYYVESPDGGPEWGLRVNFVLLFPTNR